MKILSLIFGLILLAISAEAQNATVTLAWSKETDPTVVGYDLYQGGASRIYTNTVSLGNVTNTVVSNLVSGSTYYFAVSAVASWGGVSGYSTEIAYTVPVPLPTITTNPPSSSTNSFGATLLITAGETGGTNFHWYKNSTIALTNGGNLSGVLTTTLTISNLSWLDNGSYSLQVGDSAGTVFSSGETVYVDPPPPSNIRVTGP